MRPSKPFLERSSAETGFQPGTLEKVIRLGEMAGELARHPLLGETLLLKGGTALNLCFGVPRRLSVDLDYNYIGATDRETMLTQRGEVESALDDLARRIGYQVQRSADAFAGRKHYLRYQSVFGGSDRIEIDLNYLFRIPIGTPQTVSMWQPSELDRPEIRVVSMGELCAGKMLALLDRAAPRDAWDVAHLPELAGPTLTSKAFRAQFIALSSILPEPLTSYRRDRLLKRINQESVSEHLWPMLAEVEVPAAGELVEKAWQVIEPFVLMEKAERAFVDGIARGVFRGDLLDIEGNAATELEQHPAIQWKLRNVREKSD